jgi:cytochrome c-type biogenesis protein CcmH
VTGRHREAAEAFERAVALAPNDAELLIDYADALGVAQGQSLEGKPAELVERALKADPGHWKANALAGTIAFNHKDYAKAVEYWERTKAAVPAGSEIGRSIEGSIAEARELGGIASPSAAATAGPFGAFTGQSGSSAAPAGSVPQPPSKVAEKAPSAAAKGGATGADGGGAAAKVAGTVRLSPTLAKGVSPDDPVFIFARPADGSRMPLALFRTQVKDLPLAFALDDTMAMSPAAKISDHAEVVVGARVSRSGSPMPKSGDLETLSPPVKLGASGVDLVIDRTIP